MRSLVLAGSRRTASVSAAIAASTSPRRNFSTASGALIAISALVRKADPPRHGGRGGSVPYRSTGAEGLAVEHAAPALRLRGIHRAGRFLRAVGDLQRAVLEGDVLGRHRVAVLPFDVLDR